MSLWKLEIRRVDNGYILKGKFHDSDLIQEVAIEEKDGDIYDNEMNMTAKNLTAMKDVLFEVMNYFAVYYDEYNTNNIYIEIKKTVFSQ